MLDHNDPQITPVLRTAQTSRFNLRQLGLSLSAGVVAGLLGLGILLSLAALIFTGPLAPYLANGIGVLLLGICVLNIMVALLSARPALVGTVQDAPAVVVALIAANIATRLPTGSDGQAVYATVIAAMAVTTLLTGATFVLLGRFRLGSLVRYLPYPVVGGFLAGTGWLLTLGGLGIMTNVPLQLHAIPRLIAPPTVWQWLPGLVFGVVIVLAQRRSQHLLLFPGLLVGASLVFYAFLALRGIPLAAAQARGWLLGPFPDHVRWTPLTPTLLGAVSWGAIASQGSAIGAAVLISVINLLLNVSGLQLARREDSDLNAELRAAGGAQLVAGLIGQPPSFPSLSLSTLAHRMGAQSRLVGIVVGLVSGAAFFVGGPMLALVPRVVLGGLVCYLGLSFLVEWLYDTWFRVPRSEYAVIVLILALIITVGVLPGVIAGLGIAVVLFVVIYSRIEVVKHALTGASMRSRMTRSYADQAWLRQHGDQIAIFQLQGFLFFGTVHNLYERVRTAAQERRAPPLRFVLLDLRAVPRLDSTALLSFNKLAQLATAQGFVIVWTQLTPRIRRQVEHALLSGADAAQIRIFGDLDHGLEWCENQLLAATDRTEHAPPTLAAQLARIVPDAPNIDRLLVYFEQHTVAPGTYLIRPNEPPQDMFFVEAGQVTAQTEAPDGAAVRLETMRGGRAVGELGFYLGTRRTAAVIADAPSRVYRITRDDLRRMEHADPEAAATFHQIMAGLLSERAVHLIDTVNALQR